MGARLVGGVGHHAVGELEELGECHLVEVRGHGRHAAFAEGAPSGRKQVGLGEHGDNREHVERLGAKLLRGAQHVHRAVLRVAAIHRADGAVAAQLHGSGALEQYVPSADAQRRDRILRVPIVAVEDLEGNHRPDHHEAGVEAGRGAAAVEQRPLEVLEDAGVHGGDDGEEDHGGELRHAFQRAVRVLAAPLAGDPAQESEPKTMREGEQHGMARSSVWWAMAYTAAIAA